MARVLRPRVPRYPPHPRTEPPELPLKVPPESPRSSPRSSPVSSPSGYLTSTLGGPFWTKGSKGEHKVRPRNDRNEDSPGPGDYSPEHPGIRGRIPGRVPGFPDKPNAARCNQPGLQGHPGPRGSRGLEFFHLMRTGQSLPEHSSRSLKGRGRTEGAWL